MDYSSVKKLADYLKYISLNKTAYNSYFQWKKYIKFKSYNSRIQPFCEMCIKLHMESFVGIEKKELNNVKAYWSKNQCIYNKKLFE